jgi:alpha-methylacyl-CoA racemase
VDRLGFSFDEVKRLNRRIVYCSISSFGRQSRLSSMPAHDLNFQAMSGLLGSAGKPQIPFVQLGDYIAAMYATIGILAALQEKERKASCIDVPAVPSLMSLLMLPASSYFATNRPPARRQSLVFGSEPYYDVYMTSDGRYLSVAAIEPHFWKNLLTALGLSHLTTLRGGTDRDRARLRKEMRRVFASRTRTEWSALLMGRDTCVTPVLDIHEALDSAWAKEAGVVGKVGKRPVVNQPLRFSPPATEGDAPSLGEHTRPILRELGYKAAEVRRLFDSGAVA